MHGRGVPIFGEGVDVRRNTIFFRSLWPYGSADLEACTGRICRRALDRKLAHVEVSEGSIPHSLKRDGGFNGRSTLENVLHVSICQHDYTYEFAHFKLFFNVNVLL